MNKDSDRYSNLLETSRAWKKNNPERHAELARAYRARNREKTKAQNRLNYAIRKGRMARLPCEVCGTRERVHAHHHDYSKPLDVRWLCLQCHKDAHPVDDEDKVVKFSGAKRAELNGGDNPNAMLSDADACQVRALLAAGISQQKIAVLYGVHQTTISRIKLNRHYKA
jgi:hypothetical protein